MKNKLKKKCSLGSSSSSKSNNVEKQKSPGRRAIAADSHVAINLALGSNANGTLPFDIQASHGAFPTFAFGTNPSPASAQALAGGPFEQYSAKLKAAKRAAEQAHNNLIANRPCRALTAPETLSSNDFLDERAASPIGAKTSLKLDELFAEHKNTESSDNVPSVTSHNTLAPHVEHVEHVEDTEQVTDAKTNKATDLVHDPLGQSKAPVVPTASLRRQKGTSVLRGVSEQKDETGAWDIETFFEACQYGAPIRYKPRNLHRKPTLEPINARGLPTKLIHRDGLARAISEPMQRSPSNNPQMAAQQSNGTGVNGNSAAMNQMAAVMPASAGQQMDINVLFQKVLELSEVLKENREKTQGIVAGAEELATRAAASGASTDIKEADREISAARIADLTRQVNQLKKANEVLRHEQTENTKLIGEYETAVGNIVEMVRNYSYNKDTERHAAARELNARLQEEKDAHLSTRHERDEWMFRYGRTREMIREAYRLRCQEDELPVQIVVGLQNEVRAYRNALGLEPEKHEEEYGHEILQHVKEGLALN